MFNMFPVDRCYVYLLCYLRQRITDFWYVTSVKAKPAWYHPCEWYEVHLHNTEQGERRNKCLCFGFICFWQLTNLQLSLNLCFAFLSEADLCLVVALHDFSKPTSQVRVLQRGHQHNFKSGYCTTNERELIEISILYTVSSDVVRCGKIEASLK